MLKITERAAEELEKMLEEKAEIPDDCLRLIREDDSFKIGVSKLREGDQIVSYKDKRILVIDGVLSANINATIGVKDTDQGTEIVVFKDAA